MTQRNSSYLCITLGALLLAIFLFNVLEIYFFAGKRGKERINAADYNYQIKKLMPGPDIAVSFSEQGYLINNLSHASYYFQSPYTIIVPLMIKNSSHQSLAATFSPAGTLLYAGETSRGWRLDTYPRDNAVCLLLQGTSCRRYFYGLQTISLAPGQSRRLYFDFDIKGKEDVKAILAAQPYEMHVRFDHFVDFIRVPLKGLKDCTGKKDEELQLCLN